MHTTYPALVFCAGVSLLMLVSNRAPAAETGQHPQTMRKQLEIKIDYLLFLPADYGKEQGKKWPLMMFLHGAGERGSDINLVKKHGPPKIVESKKDFPFIVVSPQCPTGRWWQPHEVIALIDEVAAQHAVDPERVYLTGLSMGGFGTWDTAARYPERFAAIVPICGGGDARRVRSLRDTPAWVFHGDKDEAVAVQRSIEMVEALKQAGNSGVKFTRYPDAGHDSWTATYDNPELYQWLLKHKRAQSQAAAGK
jgi:predicted peptidase